MSGPYEFALSLAAVVALVQLVRIANALERINARQEGRR